MYNIQKNELRTKTKAMNKPVFQFLTNGDVIFVYAVNSQSRVTHAYNLKSPYLRAKNYGWNEIDNDKPVEVADIKKAMLKDYDTNPGKYTSSHTTQGRYTKIKQNLTLMQQQPVS